MAYVTDSTIVDNESETIYGWRSGKRGGRPLPEFNPDTCDLTYTLQDPFDFTIDWRHRYVKVRYSKRAYSKRRKKYYAYYIWKRVAVPYPFYIFPKKARTVREWRFIYQSGIKVTNAAEAANMNIPEVKQRLLWLEKFLKNKGKCKALRIKSPAAQHTCLAKKSSIDNNSFVGSFSGTVSTETNSLAFAHSNYCQRNMDRRFWNPIGVSTIGPYNVPNPTAEAERIKNQWKFALYTMPLQTAFDPDTISTLTAMLWPDSGDFEDSDAKPLVDISEAISDGAFPLGPPPDAKDSHDRMMNNIISEKNLSATKNIVDFAANAWLWDKLVLEPLVSSAVALSASVEANDAAIDKFTTQAKAGKWIKGKAFRFLRDVGNCWGYEKSYKEERSVLNSYGDTYAWMKAESNIDVKKAEANAFFVYRLSEWDAINMDSSGVRISQFMHRLSSGMDEIWHNIVPMSFVVDWFTSEYTGVLNLKNKVYMPVADWKLTVSYKLRTTVHNTEVGYHLTTIADRYTGDGQTLLVPNMVVAYRPGDWYSGGYFYKVKNQVKSKLNIDCTELLTYYDRRVYDSPSRRTDFSSGTTGIACMATNNLDPLNMGKATTLGALIWGFIT